jgi:subtilisin family serine protease
MTKNFTISATLLLLAPFCISSQSINWYHGERTEETPFNINTDYVYEKILKGKPGVPVVVAVIDSGVDPDHEDLKNIMWVNSDEIPGNGIDDDNNGYTDDIHGWNFLGNADGQNAGPDTYELTRSYIKLKRRFAEADSSTLAKDELVHYRKYVSYGEKIENEIKSAKRNYEEYKATLDVFSEVFGLLHEIAPDGLVTLELADSLSQTYDRTSRIAGDILSFYHKNMGFLPNLESMRAEILDPYEDGLEYFGDKFLYNYNLSHNPRDIIGDEYENPNERYYGNNDVEGTDAFHGTHVAGIIAAERENDIGINGVATNVKIMAIRAIPPSGDERDKDIINAIRYAVENGASVINMSFGKGESPHKELVDEAIRFAEKNDVLLVTGAGNSSLNIDETISYPTDLYSKPKGFLFWKKKNAGNYLSVGASSNGMNDSFIADFSNYGKENVDIFAPGEFMYSTIPGNRYKISQGTSMSAPVITGVAALLRSYFPTLTAPQVKEILIDSAQDLGVKVQMPGSDEMVEMKELCVSGGIVDLKQAIIRAAKTKGRRKPSGGLKA